MELLVRVQHVYIESFFDATGRSHKNQAVIGVPGKSLFFHPASLWDPDPTPF